MLLSLNLFLKSSVIPPTSVNVNLPKFLSLRDIIDCQNANLGCSCQVDDQVALNHLERNQMEKKVAN